MSDGFGFYGQLVADDIIGMMQPLIEKAGYRCRYGDGKLFVDLSMATDTPWHHIKYDPALNCHTWHTLLFDVVFPQLGKKYVPIKCQQCWKVVVRPKTLLGLFALEAIQTALGHSSKCGIEVRPSVGGLYGGYFYNHSQQAGLECYKVVRAAVDAESLLGPDVTVLLKRACTEFEHACGPSDKWEITDEQRHVEVLVDRYVVQDINTSPQPEHSITRVHRRWIEWAYQNGDETYKNFTNGNPLYPPYVTYHHLADEEEKPAPKKKAKAKTEKPGEGQ